MGLDCSHGAYSGGYMSFDAFRRTVVEAWGGLWADGEDRWWYSPKGCNRKTNPGLFEFLCHSDCDGEISPEMCIHVADELEALLPRIRQMPDRHGGHIERDGGMVAVAERFIAGCREAAAAGEPLEFR